MSIGPVTKWSALAHNVQELPDLMRRAYHAMRSGKPGPVLIELPEEVAEAEFKGTLDYTPVPMQRSAPDPDAIKKAVEMLLAAKNPVLWAGQGVHYAEAGEKLAALAEMLPAPVVATNPGKSAIADSHPLALGGATRSRSKMYADFHEESRCHHGDRVEPDASPISARRCPTAKPSSIRPMMPAISTRIIAPTFRWSATPAW